MTVPTLLPRLQYATNGVTASFAFPYVFVDPADIAVDLRDIFGAAFASFLNGSGLNDYTIVGTQDPATGEYLAGASVVFNSIQATGRIVTIWRDPPETQSLVLSTGGKFAANPINTEFDRLTMMIQFVRDWAIRAIAAPPFDPPPPANVSMFLPQVAARAGLILGFDAAGRPAVGGSLDLLISLLAGTWTPSLAVMNWVPSISGLRALTPPGTNVFVELTGYFNQNDKPPVAYFYSPGDSRADDGGLVIKPNAIGGGSPGRWLLDTGERLSVVDFGADRLGVLASDAAFNAWFAAVKSLGAAGYIPAGSYKFLSQVSWNLDSVATTGLTIDGDGTQRTILDLTAVAASPAMFVGGTIDLFYPTLRGFGVVGNLAGIVLQFGREDFTDPINEAVLDLNVKNNSASGSACAVELNYFLNGRAVSLVANCNGHGDSLRMRQATFNTFMGSFGQADIAVHMTAGFNYGNVFVAPDFEVVGVCVQFDTASAVNNLFLGGTYVWTGASAIVANSASDWNRFLSPNFSIAGALLTGALASTVLIEDKFIGTSPFGGILINPPAGDGDIQLDSVDGNSAFSIWRHVGIARWHLGRNNAAESGANVGSQFILEAFDDTGATLGQVFFVDRATRRLTISGTAQFATAAGALIGLFGAVPVAQPSNGGSSAQANVGATNPTFQDTGFTGGVGSRAYTIGQLVAALKTLGAIASS
jgi:hypothetical protein